MFFSMAVLSLPAILSGGGFLIPDLPFTQSAFYGVILGIIHRFITELIIYFGGVGSVVGSIIASIAATETLIIVGLTVGIIIHFVTQPASLGSPPPTPGFVEIIYTWTALLGTWFLVLSGILLVPSVFVAIVVQLFLRFK